MNDERRKLLHAILSRGPMTEAMLRRRLRDRGFEESEADECVRYARESGMTDDDMYSRLFVEGHPEWGNRRIIDDLKRRGVPGGAIRRALDERDPAEEDAAYRLCRDLAERGLGKETIVPRLLRRGFSLSMAGEAAERACSGKERPVK
jgi:SOS response regulatory protein OraA/RecX